MKNLLLITFLTLFSFSVFAQYGETIGAGRPGQATGPRCVGANVFQTEAGIDYFNDGSSFVPGVAFRYGLSERTELISSVSYSLSEGVNELSGLGVGAKINLLHGERDDIPKMGLKVGANLPVSNMSFSSNALFIIADDFTDNLSWTVNLGASFDEDVKATGIYVANLSYALNNKIGLFIEPYASSQDGEFLVNFDSGISYLLNNDLQLDFLAGYGINSDQGLMLGGGVAWRLAKSRENK